MSNVQIEQKNYEMPPREGLSIAHFLTVADIERSTRYYETVFGARVLSRPDGKGSPGYLQLANIWMIINVGGGPTPDKPTVTLSVPNPNHINSFMNFRVADIHACYELWKSRGAEFLTEPILPSGSPVRAFLCLADLLRPGKVQCRLLDRGQVAEVIGTSEKSICENISAWRWGRPGGTNEEGIQAR